MTKAVLIEPHGFWVALYRGPNGLFRVACDAKGRAIECETEALALSVAGYRRRRLQVWK